MVDRSGTQFDAYKKAIKDVFGSFENFQKESVESWLWIQDHLDQLTIEQLQEVISDCEVQRLIPSWMAKSRWEHLHRIAKEELYSRI